ncbi:UDP-N-acetylglucosamine 2-epimerase (hydrolyzing) [Shewanella eurypsychrophilus]|uniref:UDP-N-acetylglucosamine 2-epimerase (Hydrolyzing) n=1 Tax=Shewanella eurypsychrophilus TaxID=2593656 RepID=A0ABX6V9Q7_9GAMM|nr:MULTISPECIES: UDP-N-acetylglucosamine 2-epimerase [Shewanella]QFU23528.1 UDP-N-acetylglucosamine 2-epimerase (hydrolyzing) [Shewanella sp. YLB-09]QPG58754.1 UDP-N-acetylglucosamine 2-epimerase (hydrolyzing) [Shewanella eurypsychrophilus]
MTRRKICVVTGTRADFGLLVPLLQMIRDDEALTLQLIVTGMHLSHEFGLTYKEVEAEFSIDKKIEILLSSDTGLGIAKSVGLGQISFSDTFADLNPDLLLVLGDRFEIFSAVSAAMFMRLPVVHLYGGELTQGVMDDAIRHSITKMSHLHFTSTEKYRQRVIQLGELPDRVFNVGDTSIDRIKQLRLLSRSDFEKAIDFKLAKRNLMVTFHPVTLEQNSAQRQFSQLLAAIDELDDTHIIFTKANADVNGRVINQMCDHYVSNNFHKARVFTSLGQLKYLSGLQFMDAAVGNSSSGLVEAPSFNIGTINIGDRQKGRLVADSVITCKPEHVAITQALEKLYSANFQASLKSIDNLYGDGNASRQIYRILKAVDLENIICKPFYDLPST